jgi:hypothetical protein
LQSRLIVADFYERKLGFLIAKSASQRAQEPRQGPWAFRATSRVRASPGATWACRSSAWAVSSRPAKLSSASLRLEFLLGV